MRVARFRIMVGFAVFAFLLAALALSLSLSTRDPRSGSDSASVDSEAGAGSVSDGHMVDGPGVGAGLLPEEETRKARDAVTHAAAFDHGRSLLGSPPESAEDLFDLVSSDYGWREPQRASNYALWSGACRSSREIASSGHRGESTVMSAEMLEGFSELSSFCGSLDLDAESMALDRLEAVIGANDDSTHGVAVESIAARLDAATTSGAALQAALEALADSIRSFDEARAKSVLWEIANRQLLDSPDFDRAEFWHASLRVSQDVAVTLICSEFGGCRGTDHPVVLRYCTAKFTEEGLVCDSPSSIQDAIFQTSAPVVFGWYLRYLDAIRTRLMQI
jgi:hypothetical protein